MKYTKPFTIILSFVLLFTQAMPTLAASTTIEVTALSLDWGFASEGGATATGSFVTGPGTPPLGGGSAQLNTIANADSMTFGSQTPLPVGTRFDAITDLSYSTYRSTVDAGNNLAPTLQLNIDYDLTDGNTAWQGRLVYEPYQNAPVPQNTWQSWNTLAGKWWASNISPTGSNGLCPQASPCTWNTVKTNWPNAGVHATLGALLFKAGSSWSVPFSGNVDNLVVGYGGNITTYNFEANNSPDIDLPSGNLTVNEQQWRDLDSAATVTDADGNWGTTGTLNVEITGNLDAADRLRVQDDACNNVTDIIDIAGTDVRRCTGINTSVSIGTISGQSTSNLTVTFNNAATNAYVQDVARQVQFQTNTNAPSVLQRTVTFTLTDAAGASDIATKLVDVIAVNDAPQIANWNDDRTFTENSMPLLLDTTANATIIDPDTVDLTGTTITLSFHPTGGNCTDTEELLAIGNYGGISISGSDVLSGATIIGTFTGGTSCADLVVTLNSAADNASMSALANAFTYENTSDNPSTVNTRRLSLRTDQGAQNDIDNGKYITVVAANDAPVVTLPGTDPVTADEQTWTIIEDGSPTVIDPDTGTTDFNGGNLTVQVTNGFGGDRLNIRNQGTGAGQISKSGGDFSGTGTVSYAGNLIGNYTWTAATYTLSVAFNTADATPAAVQALIGNIQFNANVNNPDITQRNVDFTVDDGDGGSSTSSAVTKHVNINPINDIPVVSNFTPDITYIENAAAMQIDADVSIIDPDYETYNDGATGGTLTIDFSVDGTSDDQLAIGNIGTISTNALNEVIFTSGFICTLGTYSGGTNGSALVVTFDGTNTCPINNRITPLLQALTYANSSNNPAATRTARIVVTDGHGGTSAAVTKVINVTGVNDAPALTLPGTDPQTVDEQVWLPLDVAATAFDAEDNWDTGTLTVQVTANAQGTDDLDVQDYGNCNPYTTEIIDIVNNGGVLEVRRCGPTNGAYTLIGTLAGRNTNSMTVTFNANATSAWVQDVVRSVRYRAATNNPSTLQRTITFTLTDGASASSSSLDKHVNVTPINDPPNISQISGRTAGVDWFDEVDWTEANPPTSVYVDLGQNAGVSDADSTNFDTGNLTVTITNGTANDILKVENFGTITVVGATDVQRSGVSFGTISGTATQLIVTFNANATNVFVREMIHAISFNNTSDTPDTTQRILEYVLYDGDANTAPDNGTSIIRTSYVNIIAQDDPPVAVDDVATVFEDAAATTINVLSNDTDVDGGPMTVNAITQPANGTVVITNAGADLTYAPNADYCNDGLTTDDFTYTLNGGSTATVAVTVTCINDEPSFTSGGDVSVAEDSGAYDVVWATAISAGPANESSQVLTFTVTNDNNGLFSVQPDIDETTGNLSFTPAANVNGSATVTVYLADDGGVVNMGDDDTYGPITFTITVTPQNDPPTDIALSNNTVAENLSVNTVVGLLSTTDIDAGDTHTYSFVSTIAGCDNSGSVNFNIVGNQLRTSVIFDYESLPNTFKVCVETRDSAGATYTKEFEIIITNVNDAPVNSVPAAQNTPDNTPLTFSTANGNVLSVSDVDAGAADITVTLTVNNGTLSLNTFTGTLAEVNAALDGLVYTPDTGYSGTDTLTITSDDLGNTGPGGALSDTDTVDIVVANFPPTVGSLNASGFVLQDGDIVRVEVKELLVNFSEVMDNTTPGDEVTNRINYYLIGEGSLAEFQTTGTCADIKQNGIDERDSLVSIFSVVAQNNPITDVKMVVSSGGSLPGLENGKYLFYACGTATLRDLNGNALAGDGVRSGTDYVLNFSVMVPGALPETGFAPNESTHLFAQPEESAYAGMEMTLVIPSIDESLSIVGVPEQSEGWELTWLGNQAGWLAGTAFPTWAGNTLLTAHVWDANNEPGPFYHLKEVRYGDYVYIYAYGKTYTYEVRQNTLVKANQTNLAYQHEALDWITLVTCENYLEESGTYGNRRIVRAVLVSVE